MSRTMTLRGRCRRCDCLVELGFTPWTGTGPATAPEWVCPECQGANLLPAIGEIGWIDRARSTDRTDRSAARTH